MGDCTSAGSNIGLHLESVEGVVRIEMRGREYFDLDGKILKIIRRGVFFVFFVSLFRPLSQYRLCIALTLDALRRLRLRGSRRVIFDLRAALID
jgi:hypothetical protein